MRRHTRYLMIAPILALVALVATGSALAQRQDEKNQAKLDDTQKKEVQALLTAVDAVAAGQPAPTGYTPKWEQVHFIKAQQNRTYVPFTVTLDSASVPQPAVSLYLRVVSKGGAPATAPADPKDEKKKDEKKDAKADYAFEDVNFGDVRPAEAGQPIRISRAFSVPAGDYDVYFAMKERPAPGTKPDKNAPPPRIGVLKQSVTVPNYWGTELETSSVILASKAEPLGAPLSPEQQAENPYAIGGAKFLPSLDNKFTKQGELNIVFWIYNPQVDATKKPDVTIEYNFHHTAPGQPEKYFNKTDPQTLNAKTLPPQFDLDAGHQLPGSLTIPLKSFPEGDFRLEIKITDNLSKKTMTRDVKFNVSA
jgi:hypothetical protein